MQDDQLIAALVAGEYEALRELFARHAPGLAVRLRRVVPPAAIEDVLQETFIAAWRGARGYKADGAVGAWLWGIARRQAALWARGHERTPVHMHSPSIEDPAAIATARVDLQRAFATLGPEGTERRELARLVFVEDRPVADVAARLGIPAGTVRSRVHTLRQLLRAVLRGGTV